MESIEQAIIPGWGAKINKIFSNITWGLLAFLIVPTIIVVIAQNSVPGDGLYTIKLRMENAVLALVKVFNQQAGFQIDYTQRRYQEAIKVLASRYGVQSMDALFEQVVSTEESIKNVQNPEERRLLAEKYINTLIEVNSGLEGKKSDLILSGASTVVSTVVPTIIPTVISSPTTSVIIDSSLPTVSVIPTNTLLPTLLPTVPVVVITTTTAVSSLTIIASPTNNIKPTIVPKPTTTVVAADNNSNAVIAGKITDTQKKIDEVIEKIKKDEEKQHLKEKEKQQQSNEQKSKRNQNEKRIEEK